jgi:hypothetical protein
VTALPALEELDLGCCRLALTDAAGGFGLPSHAQHTSRTPGPTGAAPVHSASNVSKEFRGSDSIRIYPHRSKHTYFCSLTLFKCFTDLITETQCSEPPNPGILTHFVRRGM